MADQRIDLATIRRRSRWFFWGYVIVQVLALIGAGFWYLQTREAGILVAALAVTPLAATGFGLLTLYHFTLVQAGKGDP